MGNFEQIQNYECYLTKMSKTFFDKAWFMSHLPELSYMATSTPVVGREEQWMPYSPEPVLISPLVLWLGPQGKKSRFCELGGRRYDWVCY